MNNISTLLVMLATEGQEEGTISQGTFFEKVLAFFSGFFDFLFEGLLDLIFSVLYTLTKTLFRLIDGLMEIAKVLSGMQSFNYPGEGETDMFLLIFRNEAVINAFAIVAIVGFILVIIFTVFAIIRNIVKEKPDETPAQIVVKSVKTILTFAFVPLCMLALVMAGSVIMNVLYKATLGSTTTSLGGMLVGMFSADAVKDGVPTDFYLREPDPYYYTSTLTMGGYIHFFEFDYVSAWIVGLGVLLTLGKTMMIFVDRIFSLSILFIVSPISISTSVLDDGQHFKLWREQVFIKFFTGYGAILGINIFALITNILVANSYVRYMSNIFFDNVLKIIILLGGAVSLERLTGLIGNLVSAGAGTSEVNAASQAAEKAVGYTPLGFAHDMAKTAWSEKKKDWAQKLAGLKGSGGGGDDKKNNQSNQNTENPSEANKNKDAVLDAISGGKDNKGNDNNNQNGNQQGNSDNKNENKENANSSNQNDKNPNQSKGNSAMINNAISNDSGDDNNGGK